MSARHWMTGCLIGLACMGSAMAADMDARDINSSSHNAVDSSSRDTGGGTGGDVVGLNRDCPSSRRNSDTESGDSESRGGGTAGGSEHGGRISAPTSVQPATLGWQSLLPGSIQ